MRLKGEFFIFWGVLSLSPVQPAASNKAGSNSKKTRRGIGFPLRQATNQS
jgi:hypothetical protein